MLEKTTILFELEKALECEKLKVMALQEQISLLLEKRQEEMKRLKAVHSLVHQVSCLIASYGNQVYEEMLAISQTCASTDPPETILKNG